LFSHSSLGVFVIAALGLFTTAATAQLRYSTPAEAALGLVVAAEKGDTRNIIHVLGPGSDELVHSGDPVNDAATRNAIIELYWARHQVVLDRPDRAVLMLGPNDWRFPIPLVRQNGTWLFDVPAGREQILGRRIRGNHHTTVQTCLTYVDAQREFAARGVAGIGVYAQRIVSSPGQKDGLYWPPQPDQDLSPLGDLIAAATAEGYRPTTTPIPYHGYFYKILTRQGPAAPGGGFDYVQNGRMTGGFGLLAYPAVYGNSGIMTFIVNQQGTVYQKDLGHQTRLLALQTDAFDPDASWQWVADVEIPPQSGARE
jgi:hypothetical protein